MQQGMNCKNYLVETMVYCVFYGALNEVGAMDWTCFLAGWTCRLRSVASFLWNFGINSGTLVYNSPIYWAKCRFYPARATAWRNDLRHIELFRLDPPSDGRCRGFVQAAPMPQPAHPSNTRRPLQTTPLPHVAGQVHHADLQCAPAPCRSSGPLCGAHGASRNPACCWLRRTIYGLIWPPR